jgi:hypothetical protein
LKIRAENSSEQGENNVGNAEGAGNASEQIERERRPAQLLRPA